MKSIITSIASIALVLSLSNCTAYVDPTGPEATTTTTTRTVADPYAPSSSVTTRETTTRY